MHMFMKQDVNWHSRTSTARSADVPYVAGGLNLSDWVNDGSRGEIQDAADEAVRQLVKTGQLSAARAQRRARAWICRSCNRMK
jgi:hypothetical protein